MISDQRKVQVGEWVFDLQKSTLSNDSQSHHLKSRLAATLSFLIAHKNEVISKEKLMGTVWQTVVSDNAISRVIGRLRQVLGDDFHNPEYILTVQGQGYRLIAPCHFLDEEENNSANKLDTPKRWQTPTFAVSLALVFSFFLFWVINYNSKPLPAQITSLTALRGDESDPTLNSDGSLLAFSHRRINEDWWNIYIQLQDSGRIIQVTDEAYNDRLPAWSQSGDKLLFKRLRYDHCEIFAVDISDKDTMFEAEKITDCDPSALYSGVTWGADDKSIYFSSSGSVEEPMKLFRYNLFTHNTTQLTSPPDTGRGDYRFSLSPDQQCLAFLRNTNARAGVELWCYHLATSETTLLYTFENRIRHFAWSEDSRSVFFVGPDGQMKLLDINSGNAENITSSSTPLFYPASGGGKLVAGYGSMYNHEIWRINNSPATQATDRTAELWIASSQSDTLPRANPIDGSTAFVSTRSGLQQVWIKTQQDEYQLTRFQQAFAISAMEWSPDGSQLAISANGRLALITAKSGAYEFTPKTLTNIANPIWAADGNSILFAQRLSGDWQIAQYDLASQQTLPVTTDGGYQIRPFTEGSWYLSKYHQPGLYRLNPGQQHTLKLPNDALQHENLLGNWRLSASQNAIYYIPQNNESLLIRQPLDGHSPADILVDIGQDILLDLEISTDERSVYYARYRRGETDIVLLEQN